MTRTAGMGAGVAWIVTAVLVLALAAGCGPAGPQHGHHMLNESSSGKTVEARVGDTLSVILAEISGSGYRWEAVADGAPLLVATSATALPETPPALVPVDSAGAGGQPVVGGPRTAAWHFVAQAPGETQVRFVYRRPWESEVEPTRTCDIPVRVK